MKRRRQLSKRGQLQRALVVFLGSLDRRRGEGYLLLVTRRVRRLELGITERENERRKKRKKKTREKRERFF